MDDQQLLELDTRGRASFAQILGKASAGKRYLVKVHPDGMVVLTPAVVVSELEHKFLQNSTLMNQIEKNRTDVNQTISRADRKRILPS